MVWQRAWRKACHGSSTSCPLQRPQALPYPRSLTATSIRGGSAHGAFISRSKQPKALDCHDRCYIARAPLLLGAYNYLAHMNPQCPAVGAQCRILYTCMCQILPSHYAQARLPKQGQWTRLQFNTTEWPLRTPMHVVPMHPPCWWSTASLQQAAVYIEDYGSIPRTTTSAWNGVEINAQCAKGTK